MKPKGIRAHSKGGAGAGPSHVCRYRRCPWFGCGVGAYQHCFAGFLFWWFYQGTYLCWRRCA